MNIFTYSPAALLPTVVLLSTAVFACTQESNEAEKGECLHGIAGQELVPCSDPLVNNDDPLPQRYLNEDTQGTTSLDTLASLSPDQQTEICEISQAYVRAEGDKVAMSSALCEMDAVESTDNYLDCRSAYHKCNLNVKRGVNFNCDATGLKLHTCGEDVTVADMESCMYGLAKFFGDAAIEAHNKVSCDLADNPSGKEWVFSTLTLEKDKNLAQVEGCQVVAASCSDFIE